ncbi:MAG: hypothetical protein WC701_05135, partial [Kiritimatiellales bacterium]
MDSHFFIFNPIEAKAERLCLSEYACPAAIHIDNDIYYFFSKNARHESPLKSSRKTVKSSSGGALARAGKQKNCNRGCSFSDSVQQAATKVYG